MSAEGPGEADELLRGDDEEPGHQSLVFMLVKGDGHGAPSKTWLNS